MAERVQVTIGTALGAGRVSEPIATLDIDPSIVGCSCSHQAPSGDADFTLGRRAVANDRVYGWLPDLIEIPEMTHVTIEYRGTRVYTGRGLDRHLSGLGYDGLSGDGYGIHGVNDDHAEFSGTELVSLRGILAATLAQLMPHMILDAAGLAAMTDQRTKNELDRMTVGEILDMLSKQGIDANGAGLDYFVTGYRDQLLLTFRSRMVPAEGHYKVSYDPAIFPGGLTVSSRDIWSHLNVRHSDEEPLEFVEERPDVAARLGFNRRLPIDAPADVSHHALRAWSRAYLAERAYPAISGQATFGLNDLVLTASGAPIPAYQMQAGYYLQVGDDTDAHMAYIIKRQIDFNGETVDLTLGRLGRTDFAGVWNMVLDTIIKVRRHLDPLTGGREPTPITREHIEEFVRGQLRFYELID